MLNIELDITSPESSPENIEAYIDAAMEDGDERVILHALRQAAAAIGGMSELARPASMSRIQSAGRRRQPPLFQPVGATPRLWPGAACNPAQGSMN